MLTLRDIHGEQVFIHFDEVDGRQTIFAVQRLIAHLKAQALAPVLVDVDPDFAAWMRENRGIEAHRLDRLSQAVIDAADPLVLVQLPDGQVLLVDGTHRFVWLAEHGQREAVAWIVPETIWRAFVVGETLDGLTDDVLRTLPSGL